MTKQSNGLVDRLRPHRLRWPNAAKEPVLAVPQLREIAEDDIWFE